MALSSQNKVECLWCPIRKRQVKASPEERVRSYLLSKMVGELGYIPSLIVVERKISELVGASQQKIKMPNRRVDILCYSSSLEPLLLVECKVAPLSPKMLRQVLGYNHYIGAHFVAVANEKQVCLAAVSDWAVAISKQHPFLCEERFPPYHIFK